jgi:hypothetical protein
MQFRNCRLIKKHYGHSAYLPQAGAAHSVKAVG